MAVALSTLVEEANRYLNCAAISDYCPRLGARRVVGDTQAS